jgi:hypothetical protein
MELNFRPNQELLDVFLMLDFIRNIYKGEMERRMIVETIKTSFELGFNKKNILVAFIEYRNRLNPFNPWDSIMIDELSIEIEFLSWNETF